METAVARLLQPATLASAIVIATLIGFVLAMALGGVPGGSHEVELLLGPFRWQPAAPSLA